MQFAEIGNHVFTQAESPAASGMIISRSVQTDLGILKRAVGSGGRTSTTRGADTAESVKESAGRR